MVNEAGVDGVTDAGWQRKEHQETAKLIRADRQTAQSINHSSHAQPAQRLRRDRGPACCRGAADCAPFFPTLAPPFYRVAAAVIRG